MSRELDRFRRLAKALAKSESETVAIIKNDDGSYSLVVAADETEIDKTIIEYITPY